MIEIRDTQIPGLLIIEPGIYRDDRGYFFESYNERLFREHGIDFRFVQDNESRSAGNVIRGLHYQLNPYAQTKLLRVLEGAIMDIVLDMRKDSPSFGTWIGTEITSANKLQLLIPRGCAHGFSVLSDSATILYKCDEFYVPDSERAILYSDPAIGIDWRIDLRKAVVSEKDKKAPLFVQAENNFTP